VDQPTRSQSKSKMYLTWSMYTKQLTTEERPRTSSVGHPLDDVMIYTTIFHGGRTGSVLRSRWAEARRRQIWHRRTMVLHRTMHNRPSKLFEPSELLSKQPRSHASQRQQASKLDHHASQANQSVHASRTYEKTCKLNQDTTDQLAYICITCKLHVLASTYMTTQVATRP